MVRATTIKLLGESPAAHGVFEAPDESENEVFAEVLTASQNEFYRARQNGLEPDLVFKLTDYGDYNGEKVLVYDEKRMRVIRTYIQEEALFIVAEKATADSALPGDETLNEPQSGTQTEPPGEEGAGNG